MCSTLRSQHDLCWQVDLYCIPNHYRTYKILVAAKYNGVKVNLPAFDYEKDSEAEWFLNKNPSGKVPLLDTENGTVFESNAIARYCKWALCDCCRMRWPSCDLRRLRCPLSCSLLRSRPCPRGH